MNFESAKLRMRYGAVVRRIGDNHLLFIQDDDFVCFCIKEKEVYPVYIDLDDVEAEDWEVIESTKLCDCGYDG